MATRTSIAARLDKLSATLRPTINTNQLPDDLLLAVIRCTRQDKPPSAALLRKLGKHEEAI